MSSATAPPADIRLDCHPSKSGNTLVFEYRVENQGPAEAYVMDAMPSVDRTTRKAQVNDQAVVVLLGADDEAIVGKFIAPLPLDRRFAVPAIPLARRLAPGQAIESRIVIPEPLAETSPYFGDLRLREYEAVAIKGVIFTIGYWVPDSDGFAVLPVDYSADHVTVVTRNPGNATGHVAQRFPTTRLQLFKRTDQFPRSVAGMWATEPASGELLASGIRRPAA